MFGAKFSFNIGVDILEGRGYLKSIHKLILLVVYVNLLFKEYYI